MIFASQTELFRKGLKRYAQHMKLIADDCCTCVIGIDSGVSCACQCDLMSVIYDNSADAFVDARCSSHSFVKHHTLKSITLLYSFFKALLVEKLDASYVSVVLSSGAPFLEGYRITR